MTSPPPAGGAVAPSSLPCLQIMLETRVNNFPRAVKWAMKDFFKKQVNHSDFIDRTKVLGQRYDYWSFDELCLVTVLAGMHKHSFGIPGSIIQSMKDGRFKYHDLKAIDQEAEFVFARTNVSDDGKRAILRALKQGKNRAPQQFSKEDSDIFQLIMKRANVTPTEEINWD
jgi:hypothetical protein